MNVKDEVKLKSVTLLKFLDDIKDVIDAGDDISSNIQVSGSGISLKSRTAKFLVTTMESAKMYEAHGIAGLISMAKQLFKEERRIKNINPITPAKRVILGATYEVSILKAPVASVETFKDDTAVNHTGEDNVATMKDEDPFGLNIKLNTKHPMMELTKKEIIDLLKERNIKGNMQQPKKFLLERLFRYERAL